MTIDASIAWTLVVGLLVQGVWLAGITYMMWKRHRDGGDDSIEPGTGTTA
ncbi:MAG: hypothetical protein ACE5IJ_05635 [Thermoplasmata archaeon]